MNFNYFKNKKILITGASGVVGYNLVKTLKDNINCDIHVNYLNSLDMNFKELDLSITHHIFDITDSNVISKMPMFDIIFYCSGYGQPQKFCLSPEKTFILNTFSVYEISKKVNKDGKFIFISTSELYAENFENNNEESNISINPKNRRNCYILSKMFGEAILNFNSSNIDYKNIRLCLCYGAGFKRDDRRVFSEFIIKAVDNDVIQLMDDGSDIRSYIYVDDCISALLKITERGTHNLYNIGGDKQITIFELANEISKLTNCKVILGERKGKLYDSPNKSFVDITRYEEEFGKLNNIKLRYGISKMLEWYRTMIK